eukprot:TRINITY_DN2212_c0_g1_i2.p1 TRINITY_DN2212_c0_g1~~TRINITY_DN2212_c0_g1_i2.p1  ORF type:complete len:471 (-),score=112.94 TRINITY_DN2212_c0_g1_i2:338-1750(-)
MTSLQGASATGGGASASASKGANGQEKKGATVNARSIFSGHSATVEDVCFHPTSVDELCSVGDDHALLIWDARASTSAPVLQVQDAHEDDVQCVDWNAHDTNLILTGSADRMVKLFDRRKLGEGNKAVHTFERHSGAVLCVQWHPQSASVFGSSAEDGMLNSWNYNLVGKEMPKGKLVMEGMDAPPELFFQHCGHRARVVDFQWNPVDPWVIMSASDDVGTKKGGGTIHIWRMNDLLYKEKEDAIGELSLFSSEISAKAPKPKPVESKRKPAVPEKVETDDAAKKAKAEAKPAEGDTPMEESPLATPQPAEEPATSAPPVPAAEGEIVVPLEEPLLEGKAEAAPLQAPSTENGTSEKVSEPVPMDDVVLAVVPPAEAEAKQSAPVTTIPKLAEEKAEASPEEKAEPVAEAKAVEQSEGGQVAADASGDVAEPAQQGPVETAATKEPVVEGSVDGASKMDVSDEVRVEKTE